jgi:hypothetical protein
MVKEYSWAITEVGGWSCCGWSGVGVCIANGLPCIYIQVNTHIFNSDLHKIQLVLVRSSATWSHRKSVVHFMGCSVSHYVLWSEYDLEVVNSKIKLPLCYYA